MRYQYLYRNSKTNMETKRDYKPGLVEAIKLRLKGYKLVKIIDFKISEKEKAAK